jgi:hypothetical protein
VVVHVSRFEIPSHIHNKEEHTISDYLIDKKLLYAD